MLFPSYLPAQVNEYGANVIKAHLGKFGLFAALPIPYMNDSVAEIGHALDLLNALGITVMANLHGKYLGDELY
ncbi:g9623 [Coccomyxa viridis]|uniref:G9623 protein n=1 Tax=Coccomyxa viridis TaxID=1274662 RepID=A0ABP1GAD8_9CHLO